MIVRFVSVIRLRSESVRSDSVFFDHWGQNDGIT